MQNITTVLFDLDGTLVDTAPDMVATLNGMLTKYQRNPLPYQEARTSVSKGSLALIKHGFGISDAPHDDKQISAWQQEFLERYSRQLCCDSQLFPGMAEVLTTLQANGINWGIVTNKPGWLAEPLIKALSLSDRAACLISGDTLEKRKPHPDPLLHACKLLDIQTQECVYIGDDERDIQAANAANMPSVIALYGYIHNNENTASWGTPHSIGQPTEILDWLARHSNGYPLSS